jgi:hypothetical protein
LSFISEDTSFTIFMFNRFIHSFHLSRSLEPFVGLWPFCGFVIFIYADGRTPWTSDEASLKAVTYTQDNTNTE